MKNNKLSNKLEELKPIVKESQIKVKYLEEKLKDEEEQKFEVS